ncbi:DnaJ domain-containing protein [Candidatus Gracilibacteria bacterium]|nr:DnaJ domain-containing protein [Candidatus Gracilibacteria bacterium]
MSKNYYDILGISKTSSEDEIKKAYRKKAMEYHPDRGGDESKFKEINEAYSVLSDSEKKRQYDTYGSVGGNQNPFGGGFSNGGFDVDLGDIFEQFFGGSGRGSSRGRKKSGNIEGEDLEYLLEIDLKTSIFGGKTILKYEKFVVCDECKGEGGEGKKTCSDCRGSGYVRYRQQTMFGTIEQTGVCEKCHGTGEEIKSPCKKCHTNKRIKKEVEYEIEIPAGIDDGMVIKISGEGNEGLKSSSGDLYVKFKVKQIEKSLIRKGVNLYYDLEIDVIEAILGTTKEINIPVIGKRNIVVDAGTQVGTVIKITGDGVKHIDRDKKGDLFINLLIKIPKRLSEAERECFEKIAKEKKLNVHNKKGIFEKIFG